MYQKAVQDLFIKRYARNNCSVSCVASCPNRRAAQNSPGWVCTSKMLLVSTQETARFSDSPCADLTCLYFPRQVSPQEKPWSKLFCRSSAELFCVGALQVLMTVFRPRLQLSGKMLVSHTLLLSFESRAFQASGSHWGCRPEQPAGLCKNKDGWHYSNLPRLFMEHLWDTAGVFRLRITACYIMIVSSIKIMFIHLMNQMLTSTAFFESRLNHYLDRYFVWFFKFLLSLLWVPQKQPNFLGRCIIIYNNLIDI